jgi:hypothetical protein
MWAIARELDGSSGGRTLVVVVVAVNVVGLERKYNKHTNSWKERGTKSCQFWNMNRSHVSLGWTC